MKALMGKAERTKVAGHAGLRAPDDLVVTMVDGLLLFGHEDVVAERIRSNEAYDGRISPAFPDLRHIFAFARVSLPDHEGVEAIESRFARADDGARLSVRLRSPSAEDADWVAATLREALPRQVRGVVGALPEKAQQRASQVLGGATIRRRVGQAVEIALPVEVLAEGQALLGTLVDHLGTALLQRQKSDETRALLRLLAARIKLYAEEHPALGRPAFIASAPQTPEEPTPGTDGASEPASWTHKTWLALDFAPGAGLTHTFEIDTAPGRRRTVIRAVGDLDDDGETSILELSLKVEDDHVVVGDIVARGDDE
jgi:hypothetical protein